MLTSVWVAPGYRLFQAGLSDPADRISDRCCQTDQAATLDIPRAPSHARRSTTSPAGGRDLDEVPGMKNGPAKAALKVCLTRRLR